jgi:hypothetical protein
MNDAAVVFYFFLWFGGLWLVPADWRQIYIGLPFLLIFGALAAVEGIGWVLKVLRL